MRSHTLKICFALTFASLPAVAAPVIFDRPVVIDGVRISPVPGALLRTTTEAPGAWTLRGEDGELKRIDRIPFDHAWRLTRARLTEERVEMIGEHLVRLRYGRRGKTRVVLADLGPSAMVVGTARDDGALDLLLGALDPGTDQADTVLSLGRDPFLSPLLR